MSTRIQQWPTRRYGSVAAIVVALSAVGVIAAQPAAAMSLTAYEKATKYPFSKSSSKSIDPLRYYRRQCVSYVGWWLLHYNHKKVYFAGSAGQWKSWAQKHGYKVNKTPTAGSVAWWKGHVAIVLRVNSKSIVVGEYNWNKRLGYGERTIPRTSKNMPPSILHIGK